MIFSKKKNFKVPGREQLLASAMTEACIDMEGLSHEEAAQTLFYTVKTKEKSFKISFADHGIVATCYDVIAEETLEEVRKLLAAKKKEHRGLKVYVRAFATFPYGRKKFLAVTAPGIVLWELNGVTDLEAQDIAENISDIVGFYVAAKIV